MAGYTVFDEAALAELLASESGPTGAALARSAISVEGAAKRLCPVDTGRLRSSIHHELGQDSRGLVARIGTDVEYAAHVEFGTRHNRAQPFLRPALRAAQ